MKLTDPLEDEKFMEIASDYLWLFIGIPVVSFVLGFLTCLLFFSAG